MTKRGEPPLSQEHKKLLLDETTNRLLGERKATVEKYKQTCSRKRKIV